ncbi:MAG: GNAT family N-acetyltransferase [Candidatus Micrarchaeia archaeon]|jgi:ribosomal protein S18 acetylase RimI-like enzyme
MPQKNHPSKPGQSNEITVGVATKKELYSIFILAREYFPYANFSYEEILRRVDSKKVVYLVARINGRMAGYLDYELYEDHAKILGLAVLEEFRKRGVAKSLVHATLIAIQQLGFKRVFLFVAKDNEIAQKLYSEFGFACFGTLERKINEKEVLLFQKLFLPSSNN